MHNVISIIQALLVNICLIVYFVQLALACFTQTNWRCRVSVMIFTYIGFLAINWTQNLQVLLVQLREQINFAQAYLLC